MSIFFQKIFSAFSHTTRWRGICARKFGKKGKWVNMGFHPIPHHFMAGQRGTGRFCISGIRVRKGKSRSLNMGQSPIPLAGNGKVQKASVARHARSVRACGRWRTSFQRRVQNWQILHSQHSGAEGQGPDLNMGAGPHTPSLRRIKWAMKIQQNA